MRIARLRADAVADALPVVFRRRRNPVSVIAEANLVGCLKLTQRVLHRGKLRIAGDAWVESRCDVFRRAVNALHVLQQADHLRDRLRQRVFELLRDGRDLRADLGADVALDEVVDLIEPGNGADRLVCKIDGRVDQQLLGELDDGAVRAAHVLARAALRAKPRDDLDDQIDLIRQQRIEIDETVTRQLGQLDVGGEARVLREPSAVLVEELSQRLLRGGILGQHASAGDLGDVRRLQMDLQREAVHQAGKLDLLVVEAADELAKLLLRSDDDPVFAAALRRRGSERRPAGRASSVRRERRTGRLRRRRTSAPGPVAGASSVHSRAPPASPERCPPCS